MMQFRMGHPVALTWDFNTATASVDHIVLKYLYLAITTLVIWIIADGWTYFKHWNLHKHKAWLWPFHKNHHAFNNPTSFASFAISPLEALWTFAPIVLFCVPSFPVIKVLYLPLQLGFIGLFALLNVYLHCGYSLYVIE